MVNLLEKLRRYMSQSVTVTIDQFFSQYPLETVPTGTVLISADDETTDVFKLDSGRVVQYELTRDGNRIALNVFKPPAFFPMSAAINAEPNDYYFESHGECSYRKAPAKKVLEFIQREPEVMFDLLSRLYSGISGLQRRTVHMATDNAEKRLAFELLLAAQRFGEILVGDLYAIPLTESDLAASAGLTRETVNREISKMKKLGLVTVQNHKLYLASMSGLELYLES